MSTPQDMASGPLSRSWAGFDRFRMVDEPNAVDVTVGDDERWDRAHLRRLRQSADLPGLVPVIDADISTDGRPFAVTPTSGTDSIAARLGNSEADGDWMELAVATEAAARAIHDAHLRGLFHGGLTPEDVLFINDDIAVAGVGLGLGGTPEADVSAWVAPEVLRGQDPTERSDVYSLGKILEASTKDAADVPRPVRRLIMWSTSDTPEARPPSALEFAGILNEAIGGTGPSFGPAFIPTANLAPLASNAAERVDDHVPGSSPARSAALAGTAAAAGVTAAAGVAAAMADEDSSVGADAATPEGNEIDELLEELTGDDEESAEDTDQNTTEETAEPLAQDAADESESVATDIETAAAGRTDASTPAPASALEALDDSDDLPVPAAARTLDLEAPDQRGGGRVPLLIGGLLALGLGAIGYNLFFNNDDGTTDVAAEVVGTEDDSEDNGNTDDPGESVDEPSAPSTVNPDATDDGSTETDSETDTDTDTDADTDADSDTDTDADSETDTDADSETDTDANSETDATVTTTGDDSETDTDADSETDTDADSETDTDADSETDTDTDTDTDADSETDTDTEESDTDTEDDTAAPAATATGPISADDAGIQVLHGVPDTPVDVYLNGEALAPGFAPGTVAGPADLAPGTYDVALYAAADVVPASALFRTDQPILSETIVVGDEPATVIAHLDENGAPILSTFAEDLSSVAAGSGRVDLRHVAAAPAVEIWIDGETVEENLAPGTALGTTLAAGRYDIEATLADGTPVISTQLTVSEGQLTSVALYGTADDGIEIAVQRFTGLSSAPVAVPTGDSNLLDADQETTGRYLLAALAALMGVSGAAILGLRRRRAW